MNSSLGDSTLMLDPFNRQLNHHPTPNIFSICLTSARNT